MTNEETVDRFIELVCAMDLDAACELVSDDCEYDNVPLGKHFSPTRPHAMRRPPADRPTHPT